MKLRKIIKNKKGDFSPAVFFSIMVVLLVLAPVVLKVINSSTSGVFNALNSTEPEAVLQGQKAVGKVTNLFDYLVIIAMLVAIILLIVSSFFIDTSPVFVILYLIAAFVLILLAPNVLDAVDEVWGEFPTEEGQLPLTSFIRTNLVSILLGILILTGIIMYAKFRAVSTAW